MQTREQDAKLKHQITVDAAKRAAADPLPGSLLQAFGSDGIRVGEHLVRRIVANDWTILKQLNSPLLQQILEMQKPEAAREPVEASDEDVFAMIWMFTHTPRECRELMKSGKQAFLDKAAEEVGDVLTSEVIKMMSLAVGEQIKRSWETALKYAGQLKESGELPDFFGQSPESQSPATPSAGGSNTSAG